MIRSRQLKNNSSEVKNSSNKDVDVSEVLKNLEIFENLTKSRFLREGNLSQALFEILEAGSKILNVKIVNAWLVDENATKIKCISNFPDKKAIGVEILRADMPNYFAQLISGDIIVINDCFNDIITREFLESYIIPNNVGAIIDVPIRISGDLIGTICFEHVGAKRKWTLVEQKYGLFIGQLISMALETSEKKEIRAVLEQSIKDKETLLLEMNHRIKNNMMIVEGILMLQADKAKDNFHRDLIIESKNKLHSVAKIHELLYKSKNYTQINMYDYLNDLSKEIVASFSNQKINLSIDVKPILLDSSTAITCGLIVNELLTNSYKHAFKNSNEKRSKEVCVLFDKVNDKFILRVCDNGTGFNVNEVSHDKLGMALVMDLVKQLNGKVTYTNQGRSIFLIEF
ncbi:MAG: histidine kinase dimerization/phosphoacceptor domain -containing protein [Bacteroidota bacterium]